VERDGLRCALDPELTGERRRCLMVRHLRLEVRVKVLERRIFRRLSERHGVARRHNRCRRRSRRRRNNRVDMPAGVNLRLNRDRDSLARMPGRGSDRRREMHRQRPRLRRQRQQKQQKQEALPNSIHQLIHSIYYNRPAAIVP